MSRAARERIATSLELTPGEDGALEGRWRGIAIRVRTEPRFELEAPLVHPLARGLCVRGGRGATPRDALRCFAAPRWLAALLDDPGLEAAFVAVLARGGRPYARGSRLLVRFPSSDDPALARERTARTVELAARLDAELARASETLDEVAAASLRAFRLARRQWGVCLGAPLALAAIELTWGLLSPPIPLWASGLGLAFTSIAIFSATIVVCPSCGERHASQESVRQLRERGGFCLGCGLQIVADSAGQDAEKRPR